MTTKISLLYKFTAVLLNKKTKHLAYVSPRNNTKYNTDVISESCQQWLTIKESKTYKRMR